MQITKGAVLGLHNAYVSLNYLFKLTIVGLVILLVVDLFVYIFAHFNIFFFILQLYD